MTTSILWVGHEAECYTRTSAASLEDTTIFDSTYERTGMFIANATGQTVTSSPDWAAADEIWHKWNERIESNGGGAVLWALRNASGQILAQIIQASSTTQQFQVWNGSGFTNVGSAWTALATTTKCRYDVHFKGGASGQVEVWYGQAGTQTKVVDTTGNYSSAVASVRVSHDSTNNYTRLSHEIVQTTSTLSSTSEVKPPTSNGTDATDGTGAYTDVAEQTLSDTTTIQLTAAGQHRSFKAAARTGTQALVTGVTASCRAWYDAGGPTQIKPYLLIGGTRYYGTTFALGLTAQAFQYTWTNDPSTGAAWAASAANAATLEWGWEAVA